QVLTHLVDGFVIQEGLQPFPVNRSSLLVPGQVTKPQEVNGTNGSAPSPVTDVTAKQAEPSSDSEQDEDPMSTHEVCAAGSVHRDRTVLHCQFCGKRGHAHNFMRSKRFCSTSCARGFNVRLTKRLRALSRSERPTGNRITGAGGLASRPPSAHRKDGLCSLGISGAPGADDDHDGEEDGTVAMTARMDRQPAERVRRASAPAMMAATPTSTFRPAPSQWSVEEVTAFITTLPGCSDVAEAFRLQEIDGQALLLLTEDHLMTSMNIKLGPALKICAHINALKHQ
uniref:Polyhomeotic homolog 3 n=1 Tax=Tetraodon nigroviridis TaxID=99883 RepID=H3CES0_TETNG